ncbi:MAG: hypothetical protein ACK55I_16055, partial [bacterium]
MRPDAEDIGSVGKICCRSTRGPALAAEDAEAVAALLDACGIDRRIGENLGGDKVSGRAIDRCRRADLRDSAFMKCCGVAAEQQRLGGLR